MESHHADLNILDGEALTGYHGIQPWPEILEMDRNCMSYFVIMCFAISKSQALTFEDS